VTTSGTERLSCQELVELVTDYLDDALPDADHARFDEHLGGCTGCGDYLEQMRGTITLTGTLRPEDLTREAEQALLAAFRNWKTG
jgi:anti-sigma factor RsiW